jgi:hypothetical protein
MEFTMLKELTLTVEENLYDMLQEMNNARTLNSFLKTAINTQPKNGLFGSKKFDSEKAAAAIEKLRGSFGGDGHEVDRFLEEKRQEKALENEIWMRRDRESERFKML